MEYTAESLLAEVQGDFTGRHMPPIEYLLSEYAALLTSLVFALPESDAACTLSPVDGVLVADITPPQVRRVLSDGVELVRGSRTLLDLLPHAALYCPTEDGIRVTVSGECTVYYRKAPLTGLADSFPLDCRYIPLVRAYLSHRACLYIGDTVGADVYGVEYNRLLADFKAENGVQG